MSDLLQAEAWTLTGTVVASTSCWGCQSGLLWPLMLQVGICRGISHQVQHLLRHMHFSRFTRKSPLEHAVLPL